MGKTLASSRGAGAFKDRGGASPKGRVLGTRLCKGRGRSRVSPGPDPDPAPDTGAGGDREGREARWGQGSEVTGSRPRLR